MDINVNYQLLRVSVSVTVLRVVEENPFEQPLSNTDYGPNTSMTALPKRYLSTFPPHSSSTLLELLRRGTEPRS